MYDIHIEDFYRDCARTLLTLYMSFPRKNAVFVEDIAGPDSPDEYGIHSPRFQACFGAMIWLESEGYLVYESLIRQEAIDQACLTSLGLRLLNQIRDHRDLDAAANQDRPLETQTLSESDLAANEAAVEDTRDKNGPARSETHLPNVEVIRNVMKHGTSTQLATLMIELLAEHKRN